MNLVGLKTYSRKAYPALALESFISRRVRRILRKLFELLIFVGAVLFVIALFKSNFGLSPRQFLGIEMILLVVWLKLGMLETFFFASYFSRKPELADFDTAMLVNSLSEKDVIGSFAKAGLGRELIWRAGVSAPALNEFLQTRVSRLAIGQYVVNPATPGEAITLADLARAIYQTDKEFGKFLFQNGVQEADFVATAEWLTRLKLREKMRERWWGREELGLIPGVAKSWSYGRAANLRRYAQALPEVHSHQGYNYNKSEVEKIEAVLAREREDNVMLIGDDAARKLEIVGLLAKKIKNKEVIMLDAMAFSAGNVDKSKFESEFMKAMNDAVHAGNVIAVFSDFTVLARSAETLGSDLFTLIEPYLTSTNLQIIAMCSVDEFHKVWEGKAGLMERFEKIILPEVAGEATVRILEDEALAIERSHPVVFTRPALKEMAEGTERYFSGGVMPDAAIDLMFDLATKKKGLITKADVEAVIKDKTGIPVGEIDNAEREKLSNLEQILHERIIGQEEAIAGVSNALRRARAGTSNPNRPIGSFLFLGPTGVGKTETTKALAQAYFNDEKKIHRLDMSEYSSVDSLDRLMGILANVMREQPYGILLLDEFEKATSKVHNLFLQILDEGFFSDAAGKRVGVRNEMIIATSNAGSDLIWEALKNGKDLLAEKSNIIDELIKRDTFKPELLNRFDGVILFHPLVPEELKKVAKLLLGSLIERLKARGTLVEVSDDLVDYLVEKGTDPKFGARSMNRAIQDNIEQVVANKIILENIKSGQTVRLTRADML